MPSQIEKFKAREEKRKQIIADRQAQKQGDKIMTDENNQLQKDKEELLKNLPEERRKFFEQWEERLKNAPEKLKENFLKNMMQSLNKESQLALRLKEATERLQKFSQTNENSSVVPPAEDQLVLPTHEEEVVKAKEEEKTDSNLSGTEELSKLSYDELFALMSKTPKTDLEMGAKIAQAFKQKMIDEGKINANRQEKEDDLRKKYAEWLKKQEHSHLPQSNEQTEAAVIVSQTETMTVDIQKPHDNDQYEDAEIIEEKPTTLPATQEESAEEVKIIPQAQTMTVDLHKPHDNDQYEDAQIIEEKPTTLPTAQEETAEEAKNEESWMEKKRKFWEEYALKNNLTPTHNIGEENYECELKDNEQKSKGVIHYESEHNAQISKDAGLVMYQGLVQDAATNGLSITFGDSLDDKQKALLLAATLIHGNENGKKIEVIGAPTIDLNADYFKELPKEAQDVLKMEKERLDRIAKIKESKEKLGSQQTQTAQTPRQSIQTARGLLPEPRRTSPRSTTPRQTNAQLMLPQRINQAER